MREVREIRHASWVIVRKSDGQPVHETWSKKIADRVNLETHEVVGIGEWLARVNRKAKESEQCPK